jgi:hypothetical protein
MVDEPCQHGLIVRGQAGVVGEVIGDDRENRPACCNYCGRCEHDTGARADVSTKVWSIGFDLEFGDRGLRTSGWEDPGGLHGQK